MDMLKKVFFAMVILVMLASCASPSAPQAPATQAPAQQTQALATQAPAQQTQAPAQSTKKLTYCYITPGPDTWYKRDVEGFQAAAQQDGVDVIVVNSQYDTEKELANIDYCINQKVDGISVFSFNENGAKIAAQKGLAAGIPVVATDSVGSVKAAGQQIVAEVDFDWTKIGEATATWMANNYPGEDFAVITGNFESVPMKKVNEAIKTTSEKLGKNKQVDIQEGKFDPNHAVEVAQNMINSGEKFSLLYVADEDMAAAVIRMLKDKGLLNNPIKVLSENGSTAGLPLLKSGDLKYTVSSSPSWEGYIAYLVLQNYVNGKIKKDNQQVYLPVMEITPNNIDDPMQVVPWEIKPDLFQQLTQKYLPDLLAYRNQ